MSHQEPPPWVIEAARVAGAGSPCQKSKRGAAIYSIEEADDIMEGRARLRAEYSGWKYDEIKRQAQSIYEVAHNAPPAGWGCTGSEVCRKNCGKLCLHAEEQAIRAVGLLATAEPLALVHVKVVDGKVVAGGPPSCWQCSRLVADSGLRGVWLYELVQPEPPPAGRHVVPPPDGAWQFYEAQDFHRRTLEHEGLLEPEAELRPGTPTPGDGHLFTHGCVSAGDAEAVGDRTHTDCFVCNRPRSEHRK